MKHDPDIPNHPAFEAERKLAAERAGQEKLEQPIRRESLAQQVGLFALVLILWPFPIFNPIKLFVVLIHEISHVIAAYMTGGVVFGIVIDPGGAGATLGMDGSPFAIAIAGYAGSLIIGMILYVLVARWEPFEVWFVLCVMCAASIALGWLDKFSMMFGVGTMILLLFGFMLKSHQKLLVLSMTATTCCLYPLIDVVGEVWNGGNIGLTVNGNPVGSDVEEIAKLTGVPGPLIGLFWIVLGAALVFVMMRWMANCTARDEVRLSMKNKFRPRDYAQALYYADPYNKPRYEIK